MTKSILFAALTALILTSCMLGNGFSGQVATDVADAPTHIAPPDTVASIPIPSSLPVNSAAQKTYQSSALGIQFSYPDSWYLQELEASQPATVILTSFDPANPPHKLEWTDQTISIQFRFLPPGSVSMTLDSWVEAAKQTSTTEQLSIFEEERFIIANQPAARLSLISGSGGILHQVLIILDERNYEINIEGNLDLGKSVLTTVHPYSSSGLKPAEGETPAAGICMEPMDEIVEIELGLDQSGMPQAGRCIVILPSQRIKLINHSDEPISTLFADYYIDLPVGAEILLDNPVGEYLAPGVHYPPMGSALWLKSAGAIATPVATMLGPLRNYSNLEVGYNLTIPPGWNVDESGLTMSSKEVIFYPSNPEPFLAYLSIGLDPRTIDEIIDLYEQNVPDATREDTIFNGQQAIKFTYSYGRDEYYIPAGDRIFLITTDKPMDGNVQLILMSISFTSTTAASYTSHELGYSLRYPLGWVVDENGFSATNKEVRIYPVNAEPFVSYLDIGLDPRTLDTLRTQDVPNAQKADIFYAGTAGVQYLYSWGRIEIYLDYQGQVYYLFSDRPTDEDVQGMIDSFIFIDP